MKRSKTAHAARLRRHLRVRKRVHGTGEKPRLCVYRSLTHIYAQVIDDDRGHTIAAASDVEAGARGEAKGKQKSDVAKLVGELIGKRAKEQGVSTVVFDRGGYQFHGRVKALATGAREAGLKF
ncbi:MAG: 50S ribosomal protein L18 [Chloroflexi bacterium]|nr:50S ribosomal protein L18 [Chloroflexota bacterium]MCH8008455.1 50S ribosomal protein L18 [Chloroflexota bacterium]